MSVYCSIFGFGYEHSTRCKRVKKIRRKVYQQDDSQPCTCGSCPIQYQGSYVLPSNRDKRDGGFGIAAIPSHITRNGRDTPEDGKWRPWLRVHLSNETVILTAKQVEKLRDALNDWMENAAAERNCG